MDAKPNSKMAKKIRDWETKNQIALLNQTISAKVISNCKDVLRESVKLKLGQFRDRATVLFSTKGDLGFSDLCQARASAARLELATEWFLEISGRIRQSPCQQQTVERKGAKKSETRSDQSTQPMLRPHRFKSEASIAYI
ncbi:hypothetical protein PoB_001364700 [Plakobranchus ocellatus]|uniref:Uncharacterized protein n=1 Tax=Plakobranchus ocellatus TaxID=259542 RepID=A0AAV3YY69_9GAST|nr:hypothetical protein PoB_001364700 [Plakobranchus ocellatus]